MHNLGENENQGLPKENISILEKSRNRNNLAVNCIIV